MHPVLQSASAGRTGSAYAWMVSLVAATSGLLFGFDIAVINGAILYLRQQFGLSEAQTESAASALLIGCVFGAAFSGPLSDRFGRRKVLMLSAALFAVSSVGAALPRTIGEFVVARFAGGLAIGVASVLAPLYIAEISPAAIRGRLVSLNQMAIVSGILLAYLVNWQLSFLGPASWRWMFAVAAIPSAAFWIGLIFVPESPRWLVEFQREPEAFAVLARVGGEEAARVQLDEIRSVIAEETGSIRQLLEPAYRKPLTIAVVLAILQQVTGINTVLFYGSVIFRDHAGSSSDQAAIGANVAIGIVNMIATVVALWVVDRLGRKRLLLISSAMMAVCMATMGVCFAMQPPPFALVLAATLVCAASFAVGMGPCVWVVMAEIFPTRVRGRAMAIATVSLWSACVALTFTFLTLVKWMGAAGAFGLYASLCVFTVIFVAMRVPETRGRTLEQIERMWIA